VRKYNKPKTPKTTLSTTLKGFCSEFPRVCLGIAIGILICSTTTNSTKQFLNCVESKLQGVPSEFQVTNEFNQTS
jgi:hypothetical protein